MQIMAVPAFQLIFSPPPQTELLHITYACKAYYKVWRLAFEGQPIINTGFLAGQMQY
jgi:hypothetical protein